VLFVGEDCYNVLMYACMHVCVCVCATLALTCAADRKRLGYAEKSSLQLQYSWKAKNFKDKLQNGLRQVPLSASPFPALPAPRLRHTRVPPSTRLPTIAHSPGSRSRSPFSYLHHPLLYFFPLSLIPPPLPLPPLLPLSLSLISQYSSLFRSFHSPIPTCGSLGHSIPLIWRCARKP